MGLKDVRELYLEEKRAVCHFRARLVIIVGNTLVPIFYGLDHILAPAYASSFLKVRLLNTFLSLFLLGYFFISKNLSLKKINILTSIYCCSLGLMIAYMCSLLGGYQSTYYVGIILVLLGMGVLMPWQTIYTSFRSRINI